MFNRILVVSLGIGLASTAFAAPQGNPNEMLTNNLNAVASYYTLSDSNALNFSPASAYAECAHAQVGAVYNASMSVTDRCSNNVAGVDVIEFQWSNLNLHSAFFGLTATGFAQSSFNILQDAEVSLASMSNLSSLSGGASWSLEIFDESSNFIGGLSDTNDAYSLTKDTDYNIIFTIGGSNTLTAGGSTVAWQMAMAYAGDGDMTGGDGDGSGDGGSVAPGAGGLALLGSLGLGRRRRRR